MRNQMQPGTGVRTIGGMYATVKEVNEDTVLLEVGPRRRTLLFAKNAIGAVLDDEEYNRIVHGIEHDLKSTTPSSRTTPPPSPRPTSPPTTRRRSDDKPVDLGKKDAADEADEPPSRGRRRRQTRSEPKKTDGESDAK